MARLAESRRNERTSDRALSTVLSRPYYGSEHCDDDMTGHR
jgi:hypothetical protein